MTTVEMFHPESGGIGQVPLSAVEHHLSLGWVVNETLESWRNTQPPSQEEN